MDRVYLDYDIDTVHQLYIGNEKDMVYHNQQLKIDRPVWFHSHLL